MIGKILGGYRLITELGVGSVGTVYYAERVADGRRAALKVLAPRLCARPAALEAFFAEQRLVSALHHPNIVAVEAPLPEEGHSFLVMELLEGETLGARLERGPLDPEAAVEVLSSVCDALDAAAQAGVVHLDLNPENVFLVSGAPGQVVKVLDFGVAHLRGGDLAPGGALGRPAYFSPEQCLGEEPLGHRSDVYAVGVMAFELLTGRVPFLYPVVGRVIFAHVQELPPSPTFLNPAVPEPLSAVVLQALAKQPAERFASTRELRAALQGALDLLSVELLAEAEGAEPGTAATRAETLVKRVGAKLREIVRRRILQDRLALPAMPLSFVQCLRLLRDPDVRFAEVAGVLEQDPHMASRVLRIANSPLYGALEPVATMDQAVARLGMRPLAALVVELSAREVFASKDAVIHASFRAIWAHCLAAGMLARDLCASRPGAVQPDTAYLAGLLHDVGKPVVASLLLEVERGLVARLRTPWMEGSDWQKIVDESHREVAVALGRKWNLPAEVLGAIEHLDAYVPELGAASCANVVRLCNALAKREGLYLGFVDEAANAVVIAEGAALLGLDEAALGKLCHGLAERVSAVTEPAQGSAPPASMRPPEPS